MDGRHRRAEARQALGLGLLLAGVNPKNLMLAAAAGAGLAQLGLATGDAVGSLIVFVIVGSLTIAGPVVYYLLGGDHAKARLDEMKNWLALHNDAVMAVLFLVFGVDLIAKGYRRSPETGCPARRSDQDHPRAHALNPWQLVTTAPLPAGVEPGRPRLARVVRRVRGTMDRRPEDRVTNPDPGPEDGETRTRTGDTTICQGRLRVDPVAPVEN
jgi:Sap, sulfolipid-1-addressing protein